LRKLASCRMAFSTGASRPRNSASRPGLTCSVIRTVKGSGLASDMARLLHRGTHWDIAGASGP
jgi:hypothetical protein